MTHDPSPPPSRATLLIVEDYAALRMALVHVLRSAGYTVHGAGSAAEAIEIAERVGPSIDLLLTDLRLPDMNGFDLADRLAADYPGLRLLLMSGWTDQPDDDAHRVSLQKPFEFEQLLRAVSAILALRRA